MQAVNSLAATKRVLSQAEAILSETRNEANMAQVRAEEAERAMEDARAAEADALTRAERAEGALEGARHRAELESKHAREAEERLKKVEAEAFAYKAQLHTVTLLVRGAEERASNAEEIAHRSDAHAAELTEAVKTAEEKVIEAERGAADAERRAAEAEKRATEAVNIFRQSSEYRRELADATAFAYDLGFQDCKVKVKQTFDIDGVDSLEPDLEDQTPSTPAEDDDAPAKP